MATYKKRGFKPKDKAEEQEVTEQESATAEVFSTLDESASKTEAWVADNQNYILGIIGVIAVGVLGYLAYAQFVEKPKETNAANEMYYPQQYFDQALNSPTAKDSLYTLALNGAEGKYGFLDIIDEYSGTKAANLANYSAGMAYLNMQKYQEAISHLEDFSSEDDILGALAKGGLGDAFMQLGQPEDALGYYDKAIAHSNNNYTTPKFLYKAGVTALELNQNDKALKYFQRIKDEYSSSDEARTVDAFIGMAKTNN
ncbi:MULTISPECIES: tetratricopeptide repeat protein [Zobellia]|uniref:tetratricopeptide repeat protein n=1 Tax=Zobellia TaxID=112040 RepID=UPI001BFF6C50|nr:MULTISPECIES: tetratricopeptide repeat protein [Zobellia]MBT9188953.1 tetratricopeptide repeat protein [Zobellia russellii]MBU2975848.1 tetratricopeptide repeat protein [Zobellia sp. B3R18]MDO6819664.1 tetratricopeptide repeat protein [Zobellia sp. 1_MG-2023]